MEVITSFTLHEQQIKSCKVGKLREGVEKQVKQRLKLNLSKCLIKLNSKKLLFYQPMKIMLQRNCLKPDDQERKGVLKSQQACAIFSCASTSQGLFQNIARIIYSVLQCRDFFIENHMISIHQKRQLKLHQFLNNGMLEII